jgi:hypothetical protein
MKIGAGMTKKDKKAIYKQTLNSDEKPTKPLI